MIEQIADGFLAHRHLIADGKYRHALHGQFPHQRGSAREPGAWFILWAAYRWTGDKKYLAPFGDDPVASLHEINSDALDILNVRDTWGKKVQPEPTGMRPASIWRGS